LLASSLVFLALINSSSSEVDYLQLTRYVYVPAPFMSFNSALTLRSFILTSSMFISEAGLGCGLYGCRNTCILRPLCPLTGVPTESIEDGRFVGGFQWKRFGDCRFWDPACSRPIAVTFGELGTVVDRSLSTSK